MVIGSNERSWSVDVPFDHFGQKHPTGIRNNWPKIAVFIENIFKIYKYLNPFEFGGGWGLFVFHKYFLVQDLSLYGLELLNRRS